MEANGLTAIWNATLGELVEVETALQVENYWWQVLQMNTEGARA